MPGIDASRVSAFQERVLKELSSLSFGELTSMQGRVDLEPPDELLDLNFARDIRKDEDGGLEVSVLHYWTSDEATQERVKAMSGVSDVTLGETKICRWFNIAPNGQIDWPSFEHEDGED